MPDISKSLHVLSSLTLEERPNRAIFAEVSSLAGGEKDSFIKLGNTHHVLIRALQSLEQGAMQLGLADLAEWAHASLAAEKSRVRSAVQTLADVCDELEANGCPTTVMKSLDHWPDVGRDFDLYTSADMRAVKTVMTGKFRATILPRSWGDCLANKCSFNLPDLDRTIEMHSGRLGQGGEHVELAARVERRRVSRVIEGRTFHVPAPEEQLMAATLQRMYRHMFFRICEFANTCRLLDCDCIDYQELIPAAEQAGIWAGVATFLAMVCDYANRYRRIKLRLPEQVVSAAGFGAEKFVVRGQYLRVPLVPQAAGLFARQFAGTALRGDVSATLRLSLLPPLASMAALAYKVTGSNQGIW